jgi:hypothetical protein
MSDGGTARAPGMGRGEPVLGERGARRARGQQSRALTGQGERMGVGCVDGADRIEADGRIASKSYRRDDGAMHMRTR